MLLSQIRAEPIIIHERGMISVIRINNQQLYVGKMNNVFLPMVRQLVKKQISAKLSALATPNQPKDMNDMAIIQAICIVFGLFPSTNVEFAIIGPMIHPIPIQLQY